MHVLPDKLRDLLKTPVGTLVDEEGLLELVRNEKNLISIGDQVTYTLLKNNIEPSLNLFSKTISNAFILP